MEPSTIIAAAGALKPETLDAAGRVVESTGTGVKTVLSGISDPLVQAHGTSTNAEVQMHAAEMSAIAGMDAGKLKTYYTEKAKYEKATSPWHAVSRAVTPWPVRIMQKIFGTEP